MELIGLMHDEKYLEYLKKYLDDKYNDISSVMLEIPPNLNPYDKPKFFLELEDYYLSKNVKVIRGDVNLHYPSPKFYNNLLEIGRNIEDRQLKKMVKPLYENITEYVTFLYKNIISKKRDRSMIEIVKKENPDLIIVGDIHAIYMTNKLPNVNYTRLTDTDKRKSFMHNSLVNIISRNYQLIKANETIDFKELKIKFRYSLNF